MYKILSDVQIKRLEDSAIIPVDLNNTDYQRYLEWVAQGNTPEPADVIKDVPSSITRRQCAVELRERQMITPQEALDMTKYGEVPTMVAQIFAGFTPDDRIKAETDFAAEFYDRTNSLLNFVMEQTGATQDDIDDFFIDASKR